MTSHVEATSELRNSATDAEATNCHRRESTTLRLNIHNGKRNQHVIHHHSVNDTAEKLTFIDKAAYFPLYWRVGVNLYIYLDRVVPYSYIAMNYSKQNHLGNGSVLIWHQTRHTIPDFRQMHLDIGMSKMACLRSTSSLTSSTERNRFAFRTVFCHVLQQEETPNFR